MREPTGTLLKGALKQLQSKPFAFAVRGLLISTSGGGYRADSNLCGLAASSSARWSSFFLVITTFVAWRHWEVTLSAIVQQVSTKPSDFQLATVSNLFFPRWEPSSLTFLSYLSSAFKYLRSGVLRPAIAAHLQPLNLYVQEKPLLVVVSADLRQHPVGRFWLPIARQLRSQFRVISVAALPRDQDPIRSELCQLSDEWWPLKLQML